MKKYVALICLAIGITSIAFGQNIISLDKVNMGPRSGFMDMCTGAMKEAVMMDGVSFNGIDFCDCMADELLPALTKKEIEYFFMDGHMEEIFEQEKPKKILVGCMYSVTELGDDAVVKVPDDASVIDVQLGLELGVEGCLIGFDKNEAAKELLTSEQQDVFCECLIGGLLENDFTVGELRNAQQNEAVTQLKSSCMNYTIYSDSSFLTGSTGGIVDEDQLQLNDELEVMVQFGVSNEFFKIDKISEDVIINTAIERELRVLGLLNAQNSYGVIPYEISGTIVNANVWVVPAIKLGKFILKDVPVMVVPGHSLVLGKTLLDRFSDWDLNSEQKVMNLKR